METFGLPDILKSKHEENEAYISELELSWVFNNNELSGKIPSTKRTTADFGDIHKWTFHVWGISYSIHLCSSFNFEEEVMTIAETSGSPTRLQGKYGVMVVCWILGLGSLVSWNSMLTVGDYYYNLFLLGIWDDGSAMSFIDKMGQSSSKKMEITNTRSCLWLEALGEIVEQLGKKGWNFNLKHYDKNLNWQTPIVDSSFMYDCTVNCTCLSDDECHISAIKFKQKPPSPWFAMMISIGILVIALLLGHIINATVNRIAKVEDDYHEMMELKKRAEAADVAKSQFLATVSHEIRTPMNGVLDANGHRSGCNLTRLFRTAQSSGRALVSLINELLDQAKIESGKLELEI
ncbi:unnamed protein product [Camellia sinensis]